MILMCPFQLTIICDSVRQKFLTAKPHLPAVEETQQGRCRHARSKARAASLLRSSLTPGSGPPAPAPSLPPPFRGKTNPSAPMLPSQNRWRWRGPLRSSTPNPSQGRNASSSFSWAEKSPGPTPGRALAPEDTRPEAALQPPPAALDQSAKPRQRRAHEHQHRHNSTRRRRRALFLSLLGNRVPSAHHGIAGRQDQDSKSQHCSRHQEGGAVEGGWRTQTPSMPHGAPLRQPHPGTLRDRPPSRQSAHSLCLRAGSRSSVRACAEEPARGAQGLVPKWRSAATASPSPP